MAELNVELSKCIPILRVFKSSDWPQPSPAGIVLNTIIDGLTYYWPSAYRKVTFTNGTGTINIPAFYGQALSSNISEDEKHTFSIDIEFPYGQTLDSSNLYSNELSVFYPKGYSISEVTYVTKEGASDPEALDTIKPFFNVSDLNPSYLYRVDIVDQTDSNIISALNTYYTTSNEANLIALDKVINTASKEHYWCYLTDYAINKTNKDSTITLNFIDPSYKLSTSWNDLKIPESTFLSWVSNQTTVNTYLADSEVLTVLARGEYPPVFDGWNLSGYVLAILYYSYMFPAISLDDLVLSRSVTGEYATYTLTYDETKSVNILKIHTDVEGVAIPISSKYPETDPLVANGFYNEIPPFQYMSDTLNSLAELIGFFWIFNRGDSTASVYDDCMLIITSESYPIPATTYDLTGTNTYKSTYDFDDSNLRNNVSVFGRPYGLNLQYGATVSVDESVDLFGYKNFVLESPLILSGASAEGVAKNILNNYAFNVGTVDVEMPYTELVQLNQPIVLDIDAQYNTDSNNVYVYSRNVTMTRFKKSDMTLYLGPKVERTIINFGSPLNNLSAVVGAAYNLEFEFIDTPIAEVPSGYTKIVDASKEVTNYAVKAGFSTFYVDFGNLLEFNLRLMKKLTKMYKKRVAAGETVYFYYTYTKNDGTTVTPAPLTHTYSSAGVYDILIELTLSGFGLLNAGATLDVNWEYSVGQIGYTGPKSTAKFSADYYSDIDVWFQFEDSAVSNTMYYVPYNLDANAKFFAEFKILGSEDNYGLIEAGFLVVPLSPAGRDSANIPFNGLSYDAVGKALTNTSSWMMDNYTLDQVVSELSEVLEDGFTISDDGTLVTYGNIANVSGIDPTKEVSSIISTVKTNLYLALDDTENINPTYNIKFDPFYDGDLGRIAYTSLMLLIPFFRATTLEGTEEVYKVLPKTPLFVLHAKLNDVTTTDRIVLDYESNNYLTYTDGVLTKYYKIASQDEALSDRLGVGNDPWQCYSLTNISHNLKTSLKYKSPFPFVLNLALHRGRRDLFNAGGVILYSDITQVSHFYYKKFFKASKDSYSTVTLYPFSDIEGVVKWHSDEGNGIRTSLIMFANPFHLYGLSDFINNPDSNIGDSSPDRVNLTPFLIASETDTSPLAYAVGSFINADNNRYVIDASSGSTKIADMLIIDYNKNNFY